MMIKTEFRILSLIAISTACLFYIIRGGSGNEKVSEPGRYQGYSEATYDGSLRYSDYLRLSNGTQLAYDLILPARDGVPASDRLPVLFKYTPYLRTFTIFDEDGNNVMNGLYKLTPMEKIMLRIRYWVYDRGHLMDPLFRTKWLEGMIHHGYAVIVVERPGTGASFGVMDPSFETGAREADEILNWIADQEWSDGNIGMFGDSWQAQIQFAAASTGNPHLKAIFPVSGSLDNYSSVIYPGGVFNKAFGSLFSRLNAMLDALVTPVDRDLDGSMLAQALAERSGSTVGEESKSVFERYPFRDTLNRNQQKMWEDVFALYPMLEDINRSNVPVYLVNGWFDLFPRDGFLWYANLSAPRRLLILPYDHSEMEGENSDFDIGVEAHRWFDYWLKGIDNQIMDEPPIHYYLMGAPEADAWQQTDQWPPAGQIPTALYFSNGRTGSVDSGNDGFLITTPPSTPGNQDTYVVEYSTTSGKFSRWSAVNEPRDYPDMSRNDEKGLTYTTEPLESARQVVGHPIVHIWLATSAADLDVFAHLEEIDSRGNSIYITEGNLRASHRALGDAPYNSLGLPFHTFYQRDMSPMHEDEPVLLTFDLLPTAWRFPSGSRIRITITFADADNFDTPVLDPAPEVRLYVGADHPSYIGLP